MPVGKSGKRNGGRTNRKCVMNVHVLRGAECPAHVLHCARNTNPLRKEQVMKKFTGGVMFGLMASIMLLVAGKAVRETAADAYNKVKEAWPGAKAGIKQKYGAASKKACEYCSVARKK